MGKGQDGKTPSGVAAKPIDVAYARFMEVYPAYETTSLLSELRAQEYSRLDKRNQTYLDYTGGGLYADSQLRDHMALLREGVFGNPHSTSPASEATTILVERAKLRTGVFQRITRRVRSYIYRQCHRRHQTRGRVVPVRPG